MHHTRLDVDVTDGAARGLRRVVGPASSSRSRPTAAGPASSVMISSSAMVAGLMRRARRGERPAVRMRHGFESISSSSTAEAMTVRSSAYECALIVGLSSSAPPYHARTSAVVIACTGRVPKAGEKFAIEDRRGSDAGSGPSAACRRSGGSQARWPRTPRTWWWCPAACLIVHPARGCGRPATSRPRVGGECAGRRDGGCAIGVPGLVPAGRQPANRTEPASTCHRDHLLVPDLVPDKPSTGLYEITRD